jgi:hypothetical protein
MMAPRFDSFLLDLLDSVERELASALELRHRGQNAGGEDESLRVRRQRDRIAVLWSALDALQAALDRREVRIVH